MRHQANEEEKPRDRLLPISEWIFIRLHWHKDNNNRLSCLYIKIYTCKLLFSSVQLLSRVQLFATPWTAARQASLSFTNFWSPPKHMSTESVMPSNHLILRCPLLLLSPIPPSIRVFSSESTLHMRWPKYWSFSFSTSPSFQRTPRTDLL